MKDFSRYYTPPLSHEDRLRIGQALGLNSTSWSLEESCGGQVLRRWKSESGPCWTRPAESETELDFGTLGHQLKVHPFIETQELWRDLLPFPFRAFAPESRESTLLAQAWSEAEAHLSNYELSLVWVGPAETGVPLLFHYVRRRCVRLGTSDSLKEIGRHCLEGDWDSEKLQAHFGTRTGFFHWKTDNLTGSALDRLTALLRRSEPHYAPPAHSSQPRSGL